jgi:vacuolar protein-sorting-associated protein 4
LTQDAIYGPLRKCQYSKYFRKYKGKYVPCDANDDGAMKMSMVELPEPELLLPPDICLEDYEMALLKIKPTVSQSDLGRQQEFTEEFGQEG